MEEENFQKRQSSLIKPSRSRLIYDQIILKFRRPTFESIHIPRYDWKFSSAALSSLLEEKKLLLLLDSYRKNRALFQEGYL